MTTVDQESARSPPAADQPRRAGPRWVPLAFGLAALAACWNPVAAPFGLVVGIVAAVLAIRALRRSAPQRRLAAAGLAASVLAVVASVIVIALTAGTVGVDLPGEPVVKGRTQAELDQVLSEAGERTRARRERAAHELDAMRGSSPEATPPSAVRRSAGGADAGAPGRGSNQR